VLITGYAAAYSVVTSISTITLYLAYVIPIYLNWRNRRRGAGEHTTPATAPWSLGRASTAVNLIAIAWVVVIAIVFALPPNELVLWTMLLAAAILGVYWRLSARHRFVGPRPGGAVLG
jgi:L-asparagine transporter-like permease